MQVGLQEMYDKAKAELALMHERAMMAEVALENVTGELEKLQGKMPELEGEGAGVSDEKEAVLEKLKAEVK